MSENTLPDDLIQQWKDGKGYSYLNAIQFGAQNKPSDFVSLEYALLDLIHDVMGIRYKLKQQELVITQQNQVYDVLSVKLCSKDGDETKFYFDITQVFSNW